MMALSILSGFFLGWLQAEGLRLSVERLIRTQNKRAWSFTLALRWAILVSVLVFVFNIFRGHLLAFISSFTLSSLLVRYWLWRKIDGSRA